ncbi:unnamed protein product, partial [Urochloa humidicola]
VFFHPVERLKDYFPKNVVQALDGHLRVWVLSVLFCSHSARKKMKSLK